MKNWRETLQLDPEAPATPGGASITGSEGEDYGAPPADTGAAPESAGLWDQPPEEQDTIEGMPAAPAAPAAGAAPAQPSGDGLPDDHWARAHGISTQSQLRQYVAAAHGYASENDQLRGLLDRIARAAALPAAAPANPATTQPGQPGFNYWGFGTQAAYRAAFNADPEGTIQKVEQYRMEQMRKAAPNVEQLVEERLAPLAEERRMAELQANYQKLLAEEPDAKPGTPQWNAAREWLDKNHWHGALAMARPRVSEQLAAQFPEVANYLSTMERVFRGVNLSEIAFRLSNYPLLKAQLAGASKRVALTGASAAAARPGASRTAVPAGNDADSLLQNDIELASKFGVRLDEGALNNLKRLYTKG